MTGRFDGFTARLEDAVLVVILLVVAGLAGAASFTHVHDWTMRNSPPGTPGWFGWANAAISELIPTAALLYIRRIRRAGRQVHWHSYPMLLLAAAVALSLAAQLAVAVPTPAGWLLSAVPALAFLGLSKLVLAGHPAGRPHQTVAALPPDSGAAALLPPAAVVPPSPPAPPPAPALTPPQVGVYGTTPGPATIANGSASTGGRVAEPAPGTRPAPVPNRRGSPSRQSKTGPDDRDRRGDSDHHDADSSDSGRPPRRRRGGATAKAVIDTYLNNPDMHPIAIAQALGTSERTVRRYLDRFNANGGAQAPSGANGAPARHNGTPPAAAGRRPTR